MRTSCIVLKYFCIGKCFMLYICSIGCTLVYHFDFLFLDLHHCFLLADFNLFFGVMPVLACPDGGVNILIYPVVFLSDMGNPACQYRVTLSLSYAYILFSLFQCVYTWEF